MTQHACPMGFVTIHTLHMAAAVSAAVVVVSGQVDTWSALVGNTGD